MVDNDFSKKSFYKFLTEKGYYFNKEIIENYLLSLKVKSFVILTGNSGTGKTKLSQLFAEYLTIPTVVDGENNYDDEYFNVKVVSNRSSWDNVGWTLRSSDFVEVLPIKQCNINFDMKVDDFPANGRMSIGIQLFYDSEVLKDHFKKLYEQDKNQSVDLQIRIEDLKKFINQDYIKPNGSITLKQKSNKSAFEDKQWFMNKDIFKYLPFVQGFMPCNIKVGDIESSAKIRAFPKLFFKKNENLQEYLKKNAGKEVEVELFIDEFDFDNFHPIYDMGSIVVRKDSAAIDSFNYKLIPVGANWTDNTNIVGYYNVITEQYQSTPAYNLIKIAQNDLYDPYFLILDEMNLSHVERYFSDFLSSIESKEPIPLYDDVELSLPANLFVIGTVNVDETTYMFSPKVLDRANTIEFETVSVNDYISSNFNDDDFKGNINYLQSPLYDSDISDLKLDDLKEILSNIDCDEGIMLDVLSEELNKFQQALKKSSFEFGFRVINEILRFMVVSWRYENSPKNWDNWQRYFDAQIKQKILPKLHGSQKAIGKMLDELFNLCLTETNNNENAKIFEINDSNCKYYTSAIKLQNMTKVLSDQRYVSFIN